MRSLKCAEKKLVEAKKEEKATFGQLFKKSMYIEKDDVKVKKQHKIDQLPKVYFDLQFGEDPDLKRITMALYSDSVPKTAENFRVLCTGESEKEATTKPGTKLSYKGSILHRVIPGFMMQGGDFTNGNGTGGESIYGEKFADEDFCDEHDKKYLLSMANCGPNTNGSQFFLTFKETPHLDGKHVVFGEVVDGFRVVEQVEAAKIGAQDKPEEDITIVDCGQL